MKKKTRYFFPPREYQRVQLSLLPGSLRAEWENKNLRRISRLAKAMRERVRAN